MPKPILRNATILFALILLAIVAAANTGAAEPFFECVRAIPGGDKIAHVLLLGTMSLLLNLCLGAARLDRFRGRPLRGTAILLALVTIEEFSQKASAYRTFDWGDLAANYAGILVGGWIAKRLSTN